MTEEDAAFRTWAGQQATRHKFTRVKAIKALGTRGDYTDVEVEFSPP